MTHYSFRSACFTASWNRSLAAIVFSQHLAIIIEAIAPQLKKGDRS
ncbi:hypothetical protein QUB63_22300 [Microcoleus sp. ARI1-B5]